jgi:hypothetical protein
MASLSTDTASLSSYSSTGINTSSTKTNTTNNNNNTEEPTLLTTTTNNNNTSSNSNSNSLSSSLLAKRTVVTSKRKEELLLRARTERKRWIRTVTLPYDIKKLGSAGTYSTNTSDSSADTKSSPSTTRQNDCDGDNGSLDKLQNSFICSNRYLSKATSVLSELYGITINDNDDDDDNDDDGHNVNAIVDNGDGLDVGVGVKKYPLSIDEVSDRVERLVSYCTTELVMGWEGISISFSFPIFCNFLF